MRQRITFLQEAKDSIDPAALKVTDNSISIETLKAAREDTATFALEELPEELRDVLKNIHEIRVRWVGEKPYEGFGPLVGRLSPGLHAFYTPLRDGEISSSVCSTLKQAFGTLDCHSTSESFTTLPTERFSHSTAAQYHTNVSSLDTFIHYFVSTLCASAEDRRECLIRSIALQDAAYLDIDYDAIAHALRLKAYWPPQEWSDVSITHSLPDTRLEIGILSLSKAHEPEELSLGGFLVDLGEHSKPIPTLFSFPSRHHPTSQHFTSTFLTPTGLHPTLSLKISATTPPTDEQTCRLHTYLTLPRQIFADKYQLSDPLFLASKNLAAVHYTTIPVDLEAPDYAVKLWGSSVLLEFAPPSSPSSTDWTAQIPLHLRYLAPNNGTNGQEKIEIPYPVVFWACTAEEGSKFPGNPFDRTNLGYDGLFGPRTLFYHLTPRAGAGEERLVSGLSVPVLDLEKSWYVEAGTAVAVLVGFAWVLWCLGSVWWKEGCGKGKVVTAGKKKQ